MGCSVVMVIGISGRNIWCAYFFLPIFCGFDLNIFIKINIIEKDWNFL